LPEKARKITAPSPKARAQSMNAAARSINNCRRIRVNDAAYGGTEEG
jgi:hypothetical protein